MSLTTSAPLSLPRTDRHHLSSMSYPSIQDDRAASYGAPVTPYYHPRPPGSSHGPPQNNPESSPERLHSSHSYHKGGPLHPPGSAGGSGAPPPQSPSHAIYATHQPPPHDAGPPPGSAHGYPPQQQQPPITPLSGSAQPSYHPQPPSGGYYGLTQTPSDAHIPSPPPTSNGRPPSAQFTPDGNPIVPVGISGGKMFQCRGYGECDKVFTRSEHLARHVRKHTGERPFPCHCGKAFSRLDNLRQHAATVHADQSVLNDAMLNSLAPVHAALSQRANRDQRKRGEIVEVPKNAVERPRHNEGYRAKGTPGATQPPYGQYHESWDPNTRPRTGGAYDYPYPSVDQHAPVDSGPSRRPASAGYPYQPYYEGAPRPPTAPGTASSTESMSQLPYPYRPMSSNGRDLPVPAHYAESEPPTSAHGPPPQSPMYPSAVPPQPDWSSPPPHSAYPHDQGMYHPQPPSTGGYAYEQTSHHYGPPPPGSAGSNYTYSQGNYYPPQPYGSVPPQHGQYPHGPPGPAGPGPSPSYAPSQPPESPFQYHAPQEYNYSPYDRKRRVEEEGEDPSRKRPTSAVPPPSDRPSTFGGNPGQNQGGETLWLPPTTERRSSLAISALLGSPQRIPRSRPSTADIPNQPSYGTTGYTYAPTQATPGTATGSSSMPATPTHANLNGTPNRNISRDEMGGVKLEHGQMHGMGHQMGSMEDKAKALLSAGGQR